MNYSPSYAPYARSKHLLDDSTRLSKLQFHLDSSEYFAVLASMFGVLEESLMERLEEGILGSGHFAQSLEAQIACIQTTRKDLLQLHDSHLIVKRPLEA